MIEQLVRLSTEDLAALAASLRLGRLNAPYSALALQRVIGATSSLVIAELTTLTGQGFAPQQIAILCEGILAERQCRPSAQDVIDLVTTGPEAANCGHRDTGVVVRGLFSQAERSVLVAGYAVFQGQRVFQALADRMHERPDLQVRMFLDVQRPLGDPSSGSDLARRFGTTFKTRHWPSERRLPSVFYDPRSTQQTPDQRACLHAKCVVIDEVSVFISSANFTEAAQERNIEIGLLLKLPGLAEQVVRYFDNLISTGSVQSVL
ncbi:MAG TPA: DISARM system phospholipase D-like protein DrmC [Planctomycetaceae bacterium]|nr:DISARM system phospholipase D-like protein DrmC [Planctomycetaceae bacterium]